METRKSPFVGKLSGCKYADLKSLIVALRRRGHAPQAFREFHRLVYGNLEEFASTLSTRWIVSVCDTYADHGDRSQRLAGLLVSTFVNMEKFAQTDRVSSCGDAMPSIDREGHDLWDGMVTLSFSSHADCHIKLVARLDRELSRVPTVRRFFVEVHQRMMKDPTTTMGRLNTVLGKPFLAVRSR